MMMKLELKNIKIFVALSEETVCFSANLYMDGKKAAVCRNDGKGGSTDVFFVDGNGSDIALQVCQYCKENPVINWYRNKKLVSCDVETRVDELLIEHQMKKDLKQKQSTNLVLHKTKSKDPDYIIHAFVNLRITVDELMKTEIGREKLKKHIAQAQQKNYVVMNSNIDIEMLNV